ncbi:hypothetical protein ES705_20352 [subsurface metagenome]
MSNKKSSMVAITAFILILLSPNIGADQDKTWGITLLPALSYSTGTGLLGGLLINYYHFPDPKGESQNLDTINGMIVYTQKNQFAAEASSEWFFGDDDYNLSALVGLYKYPGTFYGIGPDTSKGSGKEYTPIGFDLYCALKKAVLPNLYLGPVYDFSSVDIQDIESGSLLEADDVNGAGGTRVSGIGAQLTWDKRDSRSFSLKGLLIDLQTIIYRREIGSEEDFFQVNFDYRQFLRVYKEQVLAWQYIMKISGGSVPFRSLPPLGDSSIMRGYADNRYLDKIFSGFQAEYRFPVIWRFGGALFGSVGQVAPDLAGFSLTDLKLSGGGGLRFTVKQAPKTNIRIDYAFSSEGPQIYITLGEAF